jgi:uncharacterized protein (DUF433 family)
MSASVETASNASRMNPIFATVSFFIKRRKKQYFYDIDNYSDYIDSNPDIRFGKPCVKGTRIAVDDIVQWVKEGMTWQEIIENHPVLQQVHIDAAIAFAAKI